MGADGYRPEFGYLSYSTQNIGDDFQSIAARQFLPPDVVPIDREFVGEFVHPSTLRVVMNGWFMHDGASYWDLPVPPPARSWPPSDCIDPFFISTHLTGDFHPTVFSERGVDYLQAYAPIGARDLYTLECLGERGIPSYFSGCLSLTLPRRPVERRNAVYLVDVADESVGYIMSRTRSPVAVVSHGRPILPWLTPPHRLKYAEYVLDRYRSAKCVVTTRLHAALPCLAFGTPVLMLSSETKGWSNPRFSGLAELTWHGSDEELREGALNYDFDDPPVNPTTYVPLRDRLVKAISGWVAGTGSLMPTPAVPDESDAAPPFDDRFARARLISAHLRPGDVGAEIGVMLGVFAYHVLLKGRPSKLYLIDPWEYGRQADMEPDPTPDKQAQRDAQYEVTRRLFAPYPNVEVVRKASSEAASRFAAESLDYVYIDGEHTGPAVTSDLTNYLPKVKIGGYLMGDDYGWAGVGPAVDAFVAAHQKELLFLVDPYTEEAGGQFVIRRIRPA